MPRFYFLIFLALAIFAPVALAQDSNYDQYTGMRGGTGRPLTVFTNEDFGIKLGNKPAKSRSEGEAEMGRKLEELDRQKDPWKYNQQLNWMLDDMKFANDPTMRPKDSTRLELGTYDHGPHSGPAFRLGIRIPLGSGR